MAGDSSFSFFSFEHQHRLFPLPPCCSLIYDQLGVSPILAQRGAPFATWAAGRIDLVVAGGNTPSSCWFGLEMQAVYFSGKAMDSDFQRLALDGKVLPPASTQVRRPDWRSSSAKRLMPQLQIKAPTLRRWGTKLAVAVDAEFFEAIGGNSPSPSHDLDEGDIIWLVPQMDDDYQLKQRHWEVLSLEASSDKLLAAETVKRREFEQALRDRLRPLELETATL